MRSIFAGHHKKRICLLFDIPICRLLLGLILKNTSEVYIFESTLQVLCKEISMTFSNYKIHPLYKIVTFKIRARKIGPNWKHSFSLNDRKKNDKARWNFQPKTRNKKSLINHNFKQRKRVNLCVSKQFAIVFTAHRKKSIRCGEMFFSDSPRY